MQLDGNWLQCCWEGCLTRCSSFVEKQDVGQRKEVVAKDGVIICVSWLTANKRSQCGVVPEGPRLAVPGDPDDSKVRWQGAGRSTLLSRGEC